jgi:hypothetical protein
MYASKMDQFKLNGSGVFLVGSASHVMRDFFVPFGPFHFDPPRCQAAHKTNVAKMGNDPTGPGVAALALRVKLSSKSYQV